MKDAVLNTSHQYRKLPNSHKKKKSKGIDDIYLGNNY